MFRAAAFALSFLAPTMGHALCNGPSFWDSLSPDQQSELTQNVAAIPYSSGNFWQATKDGTQLTIVGTMHLPDSRHDDVLSRTLPYLADADLLLVEATLEDQTAMQVYLSRNPDTMTITSGPTLPDLIDPALWDSVKTAAEARGIPGFMAAKMQPWFLNLSLAIPPCAMFAMASGEAGLDNMLMQSANDMGIPVQPLEPWQNMLDLLMAGTLDEQLAALRLNLVAPDIQDSLVVTLVDFYFAEQSAMGWYLTNYTADLIPGITQAEFDAQFGELEQLLLIDRNRDWIPVIENAARQHDDILIGFGAAHLFGETGVLRLLENNGWAISPL